MGRNVLVCDCRVPVVTSFRRCCPVADGRGAVPPPALL